MKNTLIIKKLNGHDKNGKIGKVNFSAGDSVEAGDVLFTIESGKGSLKYKSEFKGTVIELNVKAGDIVEINQEVGSIEGEKLAEKKTAGYSFGIAKAVKKELHTEVLIIGGGPGGYVSAIRSSQLGKKVVLVEEDNLGGTCLNYGCIPTKALAHSTKVLSHIKEASHFGFNVEKYDIDVSRMIERKREVVSTLVGGIEHLMGANDIEVIRGTAQVKKEDVISVKTKRFDYEISFDSLIIATGSEASILAIEGSEESSIMTSRDALEIEKVPESITIIGGGVIGMEFAFIFRELGSQVNVIEYMPEILCSLDDDVIEVVKGSALEKGIGIYSGACANSIIKTQNNQMIVSYQIGDKINYITSEKVMMAVGRKARIDSLDLNTLGVELTEDKRAIKVDSQMKTSKENIYAIGDVTNILQLAHVASHQGIVAAEVISGMDSKMEYNNVPSAIFTSPEVGTVGMTERQAKEEGINISVSRFDFAANGKSLAMNEAEGFVKVIYDNDKDYIIGASIVGGHGTDMIATFANLIYTKATKEKLAHVIYAHPTSAETIHEAILGLDGRAIHNA